jgi:hypothetical protein
MPALAARQRVSLRGALRRSLRLAPQVIVIAATGNRARNSHCATWATDRAGHGQFGSCTSRARRRTSAGSAFLERRWELSAHPQRALLGPRRNSERRSRPRRCRRRLLTAHHLHGGEHATRDAWVAASSRVAEARFQRGDGTPAVASGLLARCRAESVRRVGHLDQRQSALGGRLYCRAFRAAPASALRCVIRHRRRAQAPHSAEPHSMRS